MKTSRACPTCAVLARIMPQIPDPLGFVVAAVTAFAPRLGAEIPDLVAVIGSLDADLPEVHRARGPFLFVVMRREDVFAWARGNPVREALVAGLHTELPAGRFWTLAATRAFGLTFHHDLHPPSPAMVAFAELALVPPDGGPAPGASVTTKGGSA